MIDEAEAPRRLHPATLVGHSLQLLPRTLIGGAPIYLAVANRAGAAWTLAAIAAAAAIGIVAAALSWWRFSYVVREREILIQRGIFHRQRRVIPFDRVQDIAIERRLLARLFGTARVRIETGGSAADEGDLNMIALDDAHRLRDVIRGKEDPARQAEPLLFAMGPGRLLFSGLFNFSLLFLALLFAAINYLEDFGLIDPWGWITPERTGALTLPLMLLTAAALLVLGMVTGVLRTVARDYGFRLTRGEAGLRRRRGLFTLSEVVIPIRRTQVAVVESGWIARMLGWHSLSFQTLGADPREGGVQVAAPFARAEELPPILAEAGFPAPPPRQTFAGPPARALVRRLGPDLLLALGAVAAAAWLDPRAGFAAAFFLLMALAALLRWRRHGWAVSGGAFHVAGGVLRRRLAIVPHEKAQTISLTRSPLQRVLGLSSLVVDTAGAPLMRPAEAADMEAADAEALARSLLGAFHEARARLRSTL